jgi:uncharacterized protein DUF4440
MRVVTAALGVIALVFPASGAGVAQGSAETEVRQVEIRRFAAMMQADTTALGGYLADELVYTHSNALVETRAIHLEAIATKRTIYESIAPVELSYRSYGETVLGTGTVKSRGSIGGTAFDVTLRVTTVHVRRGGRWLLAAWQSTRMP